MMSFYRVIYHTPGTAACTDGLAEPRVQFVFEAGQVTLQVQTYMLQGD